MSEIILKNLSKSFNEKPAFQNVNLEITSEDFVVVAGPTGSGKTALLRSIVGLDTISSGELYIDGVLSNNVQPKDRDVAVVFQNSIIYPHLTVFDNIAFGLKLRKMPKEEIENRVFEASRILGLDEYLTRRPKSLSGGLKQRVAIGRAMVRAPKVILFDEPFSNLDNFLRLQLRAEIIKLQHRLKTAFFFVTRDAVEAMTLATKLVVMNEGSVQQIASPKEIYDNPANLFVAKYFGSPQINLFNASLKEINGVVEADFEGGKLRLNEEVLAKIKNIDKYLNTDKKVVLGIRAEDFRCGGDFIEANPHARFNLVVEAVDNLGGDNLVYLNQEGIKNAYSPNIFARLTAEKEYATEQKITLAADLKNALLFDYETERSLFIEDEAEANTQTEI